MARLFVLAAGGLTLGCGIWVGAESREPLPVGATGKLARAVITVHSIRWSSEREFDRPPKPGMIWAIVDVTVDTSRSLSGQELTVYATGRERQPYEPQWRQESWSNAIATTELYRFGAIPAGVQTRGEIGFEVLRGDDIWVVFSVLLVGAQSWHLGADTPLR